MKMFSRRVFTCLFINSKNLHHSLYTEAHLALQHRTFPWRTIPRSSTQFTFSRVRTNWKKIVGTSVQCMSTSSSDKDAISFSNPAFRDYLADLVQEGDVVKTNNRDASQFSPVRMELVKLVKLHRQKEQELIETDSLDDSTDGEMSALVNEEKKQLHEELDACEKQIRDLLCHMHDMVGVLGRDLVLDCVPGVGGQEAMLFTADIFDMYQSYCTAQNWSFEVMDYERNDTGGLRKAVVSVSGEGAERCLRFESGVHRVQRVPKTERSGRVHTSTVAVVILPQPTPIEIEVNPKDLKMDTYRAGGKGGQHVNKTDSAVRLTHLPSGLVVECQVDRSQIKNREMALKILRSRLYEKKQQEETGKIKSSRKLQMGSKSRSEKIRTYNFTQDRVTDHRIHHSVFDIDEFMVAGGNFHTMIEELQEAYRRDSLMAAVEEFEEARKSKRKTQ